MMKTFFARPILAAFLGLGILALAQTASAQTAAGEPDNRIPGWKQFTAELGELDAKFVSRLPERLREDPQVRAEAGRLLLEALASKTIWALGSDPDHPAFLPASHFYLNVGQPNADTTYRSAAIDAEGSYRIRGELGSLRIFRLGLFAPPTAGPAFSLPIPTYYDFKSLRLDAQGRFDVLVNPRRPSGYTGDWWQLKPNTEQFLLRQVAFDWARERDPRVSIERVDRPVRRPRPAAADLQKRLDKLASDVSNSALLLIDHLENLRKEGYINKLKLYDYSHQGGLVGQTYFEGAYELKPEEALIVESKVPAGCTYWSILLANDIYETVDWYNNQSSLNGSQARVDADGVVRYVIATQDPGVPNWLDTAGYLSGAIQGRWLECSENPVPTLRKVNLADVRALLPPDTPVVTSRQREEQVRERRSQVQQRPLW
jgi:hypothetical protein